MGGSARSSPGRARLCGVCRPRSGGDREARRGPPGQNGWPSGAWFWTVKCPQPSRGVEAAELIYMRSLSMGYAGGASEDELTPSGGRRGPRPEAASVGGREANPPRRRETSGASGQSYLLTFLSFFLFKYNYKEIFLLPYFYFLPLDSALSPPRQARLRPVLLGRGEGRGAGRVVLDR